MHPEVVDNAAGQCPICKMALVPVRLALVWTCPVHSQISADAQGNCKLCGRPLVRVTKALSWTCPVHPKVDVLPVVESRAPQLFLHESIFEHRRRRFNGGRRQSNAC